MENKNWLKGHLKKLKLLLNFSILTAQKNVITMLHIYFKRILKQKLSSVHYL